MWDNGHLKGYDGGSFYYSNTKGKAINDSTYNKEFEYTEFSHLISKDDQNFKNGFSFWKYDCWFGPT